MPNYEDEYTEEEMEQERIDAAADYFDGRRDDCDDDE
jgi:hypothetical protein